MERNLTSTLLYAILIFFLLILLFPFWWMAITSLKTNNQLFSCNNPLWLTEVTFDNISDLFIKYNFSTWVYNSFVVALIASLTSVLISAPCGYALSKVKSKHVRSFGIMLLIGYSVPTTLLLIPIYCISTAIGLYDTLLLLCIIYPSFLIPFASWIFAAYVRGINKDVLAAGLLDSGSGYKYLFYVILPEIRGGVFTIFLLCFLISWGEYVYSMGLIFSGGKITLPVGIVSMESGDIYAWGTIMAACLLSTIPVVFILFLLGRYAIGYRNTYETI